MTEKEFVIEMLCCLPRELLELRHSGSDEIPDWLKKTDDALVQAAHDLYDDPKYIKMRKEQEDAL